MRLIKILSMGMCVVTVLFWMLGLTTGGFGMEDAVVFSICPMILLALFGGLYVSAVFSKDVYLVVCSDAIRYKKLFQKNETMITRAPKDYSIKAKKYLTRYGYRVALRFYDHNGNRLLRYSLSYTYVTNEIEVKRGLRRIGCKITGFAQTLHQI